jgi:predicted transposase YdaD
MIDTPLLRELKREFKAEGRQEGLLEGRQRGLQEGLALAILQTLERRFGKVDPAIRSRLGSVRDPERLLQLHFAAFEARDLAAFEAAFCR